MKEKISAELLQECERAERSSSQQEIPVIVTLTGKANRSELETNGLRINSEFDFISAVSGTATPAGVKNLAHLDQVEKVEFDGQVSIASA